MIGEPIRSRDDLRTPDWELHLPPERAGWRYSGLRIARIAPGETREIGAEGDELLLFALEGGCEITVGGARHLLRPRSRVFAASPDVLYVPRDATALVRADAGVRLAVASAAADVAHPVQFRAAEDIPTSTRGSGLMAREVRDLAAVGVIDADRLIVCEVITPRGNWSSYPPHKHDVDLPDESALEELYYFEASDPVRDVPIGYVRLAASDERPIDGMLEFRDGDTVLVPYGWHGPVVASPHADLYQLNVMAGSGLRRWLVTDHADYAWVRSTW